MRASILVAASLLTACSTVNPAMKARTDELVAKAGSHREPAPSSYEPRPWKAGSWSYQSHDISKMLYKKMPMTPEQSGEYLLRVVSKHNDEQTVDFDQASNPMAWQMMTGMMKTMINAPTDVSAAPKETVTTLGGTFEGTARYQGSWSLGPVTQTVDGWFHPALPVNGVVKGRSTDGSFTMEVIDYGWSGATSALP